MELHNRRLSQAQLALRTGLSTKTINQIVQGLAPLTPDTALRLERTLGTPSHMWNRLEALHQDHEVRKRSRENLKQSTGWLREFPISELVSLGILTASGSYERVEQLLAFFQVADVDAYRRVWSEPIAAGFRRAQHLTISRPATAVWLRLAEIDADQLAVSEYEPAAFAAVLPALRELTKEKDDTTALRHAQERCAEAGVAVAYVPEISGSRVCGAARWTVSDRPMIALSGRYRYADIFWFSFFHEAAHLLLHPKRAMYVHVDNADGDNADGLEDEADRFAARHLVRPSVAKQLAPGMPLDAIRKLADEGGVDVGIIAGHVCHRFGEWRRLAPLRRRINMAS